MQLDPRSANGAFASVWPRTDDFRSFLLIKHHQEPIPLGTTVLGVDGEQN